MHCCTIIVSGYAHFNQGPKKKKSFLILITVNFIKKIKILNVSFYFFHRVCVRTADLPRNQKKLLQNMALWQGSLFPTNQKFNLG